MLPQGECSRQRMRHPPGISSSRKPQAPSFTSMGISLVHFHPLGLVRMDLLPSTFPSRWRIRMRGTWSQAFRSTPQNSRDPARTPLAIPSCSKTRSGGSTKKRNLARGKRRRKRRAWMEMMRTTATIQGRRDILGNAQGLGRVLQLHKGVCSHTKGSTVDAVFRLNFQGAGVVVCRSLQKCNLGNTRPIPPHPGSRPYLGIPRGVPRMESYRPPLSYPGPWRQTPLLSFALRVC